MSEIYETETGKKLKNSASRILLARAYTLELRGETKRAEKVFLNVAENCSDTFCLHYAREKFIAMSKAVNFINSK